MNKTVVLAALLLSSACQKNDPAARQGQENAAALPPSEAKADVPKLEGKWSVARIAGVADADTLGMTAAITGDSAILSAGCLRRAWSFKQDRNMVGFTMSPGGSSNCGGQAPGASEETAFAAVSDANIVIFSKDGKEASLSGPGGSVTLTRR